VRRFNFLHYSSVLTESERLGTNPEVTIRTRGVMEKCTYCIQRVNNTRIEMEKAQVRLEEQMKKSRDPKDRDQLRDQWHSTRKRLLDTLETACQQSCPTEAIAFGDLNDETSHIFRLKQEPHDYGLLADLATKPRTTYLARVRNPNPEMETTAQAHEKIG
jgi:molybdopterin-containing oxidoreductase family iron-sulfur binding subunit